MSPDVTQMSLACHPPKGDILYPVEKDGVRHQPRRLVLFFCHCYGRQMKLTPSKPPLGPLATFRSLWYNVNCKSVLQDNDGWQEHSIQKTSANRTLSGTIPPAATFGNYGTIQLACVFLYEKRCRPMSPKVARRLSQGVLYCTL